MKIVSFSCFVAVLLALAFLSGCVAPTTARVDTDVKSSLSRPFAILLVGNSFSFGVAKELKRLAVRQGVPARIEQVTHSGWSLAQHAKCENTLRCIRDRHWDVVILQEQSRIPSQPVKRTFRMLPAVRQLANLARAHGAEAVLYQTWGYRNGDSFRKSDDFTKMTARIRDGYQEAASHAGELRVLLVGDAWENAMSKGDGVDLFQADGMHPSRQGDQLTAAVMFRELFPSHGNQAEGIKQMPAAASPDFSGSP